MSVKLDWYGLIRQKVSQKKSNELDGTIQNLPTIPPQDTYKSSKIQIIEYDLIDYYLK